MLKPKGVITTYTLVFGAIFLVLLTSLLGFISAQLKLSKQKVAWNESLHIAEAGINYYRWCLNNNVEGNCLLEKDYLDQNGNPIGSFSLSVEASSSCGEVVSRNILSTGRTNAFPEVIRKVSILYGRESVAKNAYLLNDNVWAGADREIRGLYHSNGGVRMDGENQSLVTSAQPTWLCTSSFGCDYWDCPQGCTREGDACRCPGVFTTTDNSNTDLFEWPVPSFDFEGITIDLAKIKEATEPHPQQYYWPPVTEIDTNGEGYHVIFLNNGTFEVWIITDLNSTYAYSLEEGWHYDDFVINAEYKYGDPIPIDPDCSLIFIEDNLWVEGEVKGKVTIASADLSGGAKDTSVVLSGEINYTTLDGSDGLSVIGEENVLISPDSPDQMELRGIFVAQKGRFGRNHYPSNIREKLEIYGSIISNGRVGTQWTSGGQIVSGYLKRENYIDSSLIYFPPPFIPYISPEFKLINWQEVE